MAHLLSACTMPGSKIAIFESPRSGARLSTNSLGRKDGFVEYMQSVGRENDLIETCYTSTIPEENSDTVKRIIQEYPGLQGIAALNSRGSSLAEILEERGCSHINIISFDLTMRNIECLRKGSIGALLCQHPFKQGYMAASTLVRYVMQGITPESVHNYLPIDIVLKETIDLYKE